MKTEKMRKEVLRALPAEPSPPEREARTGAIFETGVVSAGTPGGSIRWRDVARRARLLRRMTLQIRLSLETPA